MITIESSNKKILGDFSTIFNEDGIIYGYIYGTANKVILGLYEPDRAVKIFKDIKSKLQEGMISDCIEGRNRIMKVQIYEMPKE